MSEDEMKTAAEQMRRDMRFRALVDSTVAAVMDGREIDAGHPYETAHGVARDTAVLMLKRIYEQDAELHALRAERDAYKKIAFDSAKFKLPELVISAESPER